MRVGEVFRKGEEMGLVSRFSVDSSYPIVKKKGTGMGGGSAYDLRKMVGKGAFRPPWVVVRVAVGRRV